MPSLARSVPKPLKVPSLARSVPKPLKVPSLGRSVPKPLKVPSLARSVHKPLKVPSLVYGWDGWGIKSVLQFSLYLVCMEIMFICTYMCNQNLSPTFLWVSKFDVKLESCTHENQNPNGDMGI